MQKCCERIYSKNFDDQRGHECVNNGRYEVNGYWYCGVHNPNRPESKQQVQARVTYNLTQLKRDHAERCVKLIAHLAGQKNTYALDLIVDRNDKRDEILSELPEEERAGHTVGLV